jgi:hypothetical protein
MSSTGVVLAAAAYDFARRLSTAIIAAPRDAITTTATAITVVIAEFSDVAAAD